MPSALNLLIFLLWLQSALIDFIQFTHIWQLKEYRWDRFRDFLSTIGGRDYFLRYRLLWRSLLAMIIFFWPVNDLLIMKYLIIAIFSADFLNSFYLYFKKWLRRPRFTKKAVLIIALAIMLEGGLFLLKKDWIALVMLLVLRFITLSLIVQFMKLPTDLAKKYYLGKAAEKIQQHQDHLIVIGITGSYGKTTVKNFLAQILASRFKVFFTPKNTNTEIGVADFILRQNLDKLDILIIEMGAYREREIKKIAEMVKPQIGILTAINPQHLSLFGNLKNIQTAKYELLRSLPANGLAVTNADNALCLEFLAELNCRIKTFGLEPENRPDLLIKETKSVKEGIICTIEIKGESWQMSAPLIGEYNALNIAPAILAALHLGLTKEEIIKQVARLQMPPDVLNVYAYGNCTVIDDSANANPNGFKAALNDLLNKMPSEKRRVVITRGMLELGEKSEELHEKIGEEIAFSADELVIITKDFVEPLKRGGLAKYHLEIKTILDRGKLLAYVKTLKNTNAVILLENRIPSLVYKEIKGE